MYLKSIKYHCLSTDISHFLNMSIKRFKINKKNIKIIKISIKYDQEQKYFMILPILLIFLMNNCHSNFIIE
jgi:hypothetical protein